MTTAAEPPTRAALPAAPPNGGAPPGAPPTGPPFQSALEAESARTATAEGHQGHSQSPTALAPGGEGANPARPAHGTHRNDPAQLADQGPAHVADRPTPDQPGGTADARVALPASDPASSSPSPLDRALSASPPATEQDGAHASRSGASTSTDSVAEATDLPARAGDSPPTDAHPPGDSAVTAGGLTADSPPAGGPTADSPTASSDPAPAHATLGSAAPAALPGTLQEPGLTNVPRDHSTSPSATATPRGLPATHTGSASAGSGGWSSQAGAHQPGGQATTHLASGSAAHDRLWVPESAESSLGSGEAVELAAGAGAAQSSTTPGGDPQAPLLEYGVGLQQAIETLHGTIQLAAGQGLAQARIALQPEELGEIRIHLTQTAQGLLARVTAETPAAAQALAAAHSELRQSLSSLGINLARLEIGHHDPSAAQHRDPASGGSPHNGPATRGETSARANRAGRSTPIALTADPTSETNAPLAPTHGTLLDVLV